MASLIFRKTAQGSALIASRSEALPRALRNLLILVNGRADAGALLEHARALQLDGGALVELVRRGLIEPLVDERFLAMETGVFARHAGPAAPLTLDTLEQIRSVELARAYAAAFLREYAGDRSDAIASVFVRATTCDELRGLIENAAQVIATISGIDTAARFTRRVLRLLPDADVAPRPATTGARASTSTRD